MAIHRNWIRIARQVADAEPDEGAALGPEGVRQLLTELDRLQKVEVRVERLLAECDRTEAHLRAHVPHLLPTAGTFSVHAIRRVLREDPSGATEGDA